MTREAEIQARVDKATNGPLAVAVFCGTPHIVPLAQVGQPYGAAVDPGRDSRYAQPIATIVAEQPFEGCEAFPWRHFAGTEEVAANANLFAHAPDDLAYLLAEVSRLRALVRDVAQSGVVTERGGYKTVQIDRPVWDDLRKELEADRAE